MPTNYFEALRKLPIFRGLSKDDVLEISRLFRTLNCEAGTVVCREGEAAKSVFVIETGCVRVEKATNHGDQQILAHLESPTVIGEVALLDGAPRSATVIADTTLKLHRIDRAEFDGLRAQFRPSAFKVVRNLAMMMCDRLRDTNEKIDSFFADPEASLAAMRQRQKELFQKRQANRGQES